MIIKNITAHILGAQIPKGKVKLCGAKNSAIKLLAAALISDEDVLLENFPTKLVDVNYKIKYITESGGRVIRDDLKKTLLIQPEFFKDKLLDDYFFPIRTTYLLVPGLIKKSGRARIPYPGGCKIGKRGYDLHIMVWEKFGAIVKELDEYIEITAPEGFRPNKIEFPISSIGGTESALICASITEGESTIRNAYISPEVDDLISFLRTLGVKIDVVGNSFIKVIGKAYLKGSIFTVMPDRIEAITWIIYGILSGGDITIEDVPFNAMQIPLIHLQEAGVDYYRNKHNIRVTPDCLKNGVIQPFELATGTHPGVISDMQPFYVLLALYADGISRIFDYRYPERVQYLDELSKFYPGQIEWQSGQIVIKGYGNKLSNAAHVKSTDLRGSMAVVIAALLSNGKSTIENVEMALRGYNNLESKLRKLGVEIEI